MTAIIPFPMLMPSPHRNSFYSGGGSSYAVREQTRQQGEQHKEVMSALKEIAKGKIAVTVRAGDVLPVATEVETRLEGPARDYSAACARWDVRYRRVRKRADAREKRAEEKRKAEDELAFEREVAEYIAKNSRWYRRIPLDEAREAVRTDRLFKRSYRDDGHYKLMTNLYLCGLPNEVRFKSYPRKPEGYDDLPLIREIKSAASISPDAVLNIPIESVKALQRWMVAE